MRPHAAAAIAILLLLHPGRGTTLAAAPAEAAPVQPNAVGGTGRYEPGRRLTVGSAQAVPGRKVRGGIKVGETSTGGPRTVPVSIVAGRRPGPVVWINACAHGDEYGGARALQQVVAGLDPGTMSGAVVAAMISNPAAFEALQRSNPNLDDQLDTGDAWPGQPRFATERMAAALHDAVTRSSAFFVDLHTGGDRFRQHPFVLYTVTGTVPPERVDALARGFGLPTLWRDTVKVFPSDAVAVLGAAGIPAFLLEVGGGQPLDPADIKLQSEAVRNFLRAAGVLAGAPPRPARTAVVSGLEVITNARGGFWDAAVKPGDQVKEGSALGTITDAYGEVVETLRAPAGAGIVLGVSTYPAAPTGGWLVEVGTGLTETEP